MDALVLAAGRGTRLRPLTDRVPKPLVPVDGRPTLLRVLDVLPERVDRILIVVGYLGNMIRETLGPTYNGRPVVYVEQSPLDGTGGAVARAQPWLRGERFLVLNGDDLYGRADLAALCDAERAGLVSAAVLDRPRQTWRVEGGLLRGLQTTAAGAHGLIAANAYVLGPEWFAAPRVLTPGKSDEWSLPHTLVQLLDRFPYRAIEASFWLPCGTPDELRRAEAALRSGGPS